MPRYHFIALTTHSCRIACSVFRTHRSRPSARVGGAGAKSSTLTALPMTLTCNVLASSRNAAGCVILENSKSGKPGTVTLLAGLLLLRVATRLLSFCTSPAASNSRLVANFCSLAVDPSRSLLMRGGCRRNVKGCTCRCNMMCKLV